MRKHLPLLVIVITLLLIAPKIYLPIMSQAGFTSTDEAYSEIDRYLDRKIESARTGRVGEPTKPELWEILRIPPECLTKVIPVLIEETKVMEVEGVEIFLVRLEICEGEFRLHGLLGKKTGSSGAQPLIITPPGSGGIPEGLFGLTQEDVYHRYALKLAQRNYIVFAPALVTNPAWLEPQRNQLHKRAITVDKHLLGIEVGQLMSMLDYLSTRPDVDSARVGVYGLSLGGMLSALWGAADERIQATVGSNWIEDREGKLAGHDYPLAMWKLEYSTYVYIPGWLLRYDDLVLARMIHPRGLFIEVGGDDPRRDPVQALWPQLQEIYSDNPGALGLDIGDGGHEIFFDNAAVWLDGQLK